MNPAADTQPALCRILALDGGGAKGFYTLGVLREIEALVAHPLHQRFDLLFGTSTGAIIAALIALGKTINEIHVLYKEHVPTVMRAGTRSEKSAALKHVADTIFDGARFEDLKTELGIVATRWDFEKPMIFKASVGQATDRRQHLIPASDAQSQTRSRHPAPHIRSSTGRFFQRVQGIASS